MRQPRRAAARRSRIKDHGQIKRSGIVGHADAAAHARRLGGGERAGTPAHRHPSPDASPVMPRPAEAASSSRRTSSGPPLRTRRRASRARPATAAMPPPTTRTRRMRACCRPRRRRVPSTRRTSRRCAGNATRLEYRHYIESKHYRQLEDNGRGANCVTCHGAKAGTVPTAATVARTCETCHNPDRADQTPPSRTMPFTPSCASRKPGVNWTWPRPPS